MFIKFSCVVGYLNGLIVRFNIFQNGDYVESSVSLSFPDLPIPEMIPQLVQKAIDEGTSRMLRELKLQLR
jgi:hypothetical protein